MTSFNTKYGTAGSRLDSCQVCHTASPPAVNSYGNAVLAQLNLGRSITTSLTNVEGADSDGDGVTNRVEIVARFFPGNSADKPIGFQRWQIDQFGTTTNSLAAHNADPDTDGVVNLLEFAFGTLPRNRGSAALPSPVRTNGFLALKFPRVTNATDITYTVQESTNLLTWLTVTNLTSTNAPFGTITIKGTNLLGPNLKRSYLRVRVSKP